MCLAGIVWSNTPGLATSAGTFAAPVALGDNTWGYAVPGAGGFDANYAAPTPALASKWADPAATATIKNTSAAAVDDTTSIYYGAKVDMSLAFRYLQ